MSKFNFDAKALEGFTKPLTDNVQDNDTFNDIREEFAKELRIMFSPSDKHFIVHNYETAEHGKVTLRFKSLIAHLHHKSELKQIIVNNPASPDDFSTSRTFFLTRDAYFNDKKGTYTSPLSGYRRCDDFTAIANTIGKENVKFYDAFRFRISALIPTASYTIQDRGREETIEIKNVILEDVSLAYKINSSKFNEKVLKDFEQHLNNVMTQARQLMMAIRAAGRDIDTSGILFEFFVGTEHPNKYIDKTGKEQTNSLNYLGISLTRDIEKGNLTPYETPEYKQIMDFLNEEVEYTGYVVTDEKTKLRVINDTTRTISKAESIRQEQMKFILGTTDNNNYVRNHEATLKGLGYESGTIPALTQNKAAKVTPDVADIEEAEIISADDMLA